MDKCGFVFGTSKIGDKGQVVIPKDARDLYGIKPGDSVVVVGNANKGIVIVKADQFLNVANNIVDVVTTLKKDE